MLYDFVKLGNGIYAIKAIRSVTFNNGNAFMLLGGGSNSEGDVMVYLEGQAYKDASYFFLERGWLSRTWNGILEEDID